MPNVSMHIRTDSKAPEKLGKMQKLKNWFGAFDPKTFLDDANAYLANLAKIKTKEKVQFFRLLAVMINSGMSIVKALRVLSDQTGNAHLSNVIDEIADKIEAGNSFSDAVQDYTDIFTPSQIGMIESGEATGRLNEILLQIASEAEKRATINRKIRGAMIYPMVVITLLVAAAIAIIVLVMPRIAEMFDQLGGELPASTQALIGASDFLTSATAGLSNVIWLIISLFVIVWIFIAWKKTKVGAYIWAQILLKTPVFGKLSQKVALARFARGLSTLSGSGVSIIKSLHITADAVGNPVYQKRINQIADDVKQGITMGENMKDDEKHFPSMVVGMVSVAEQTAQIDTVTEKIAEFYEDEIDDMVSNLSSLMEPIIIVVLGAAVGFLVISVMMPILQSSDLAFG